MAVKFLNQKPFDAASLPQRPRALSLPDALKTSAEKTELEGRKALQAISHHKRAASLSGTMDEEDREVASIIKNAEDLSNLETDLNKQFINTLALLLILKEKAGKVSSLTDLPSLEKGKFLAEFDDAILFNPENLDFKENAQETKTHILELFKISKTALYQAYKILKTLKQKDTLTKEDLVNFNLVFNKFKEGKILRHQGRVLYKGHSRALIGQKAQTAFKKVKPIPKSHSFI
jgi:hypothetical protein